MLKVEKFKKLKRFEVYYCLKNSFLEEVDIEMKYSCSITTIMSNGSASLLMNWEELTPGHCFTSYTTNPIAGDYGLNASAIDGHTEELMATHPAGTLENATQ
ncbi:hypothetical protein R103_I10506 [Saccharomyces cerevisiae R103]|nr:hypothetical protein R103_I10506 [Saccharomyces cerevisiae R103]